MTYGTEKPGHLKDFSDETPLYGTQTVIWLNGELCSPYQAQA